MLVAVLVLLALADARPGVSPDTPWSCPDSHPIKSYRMHSGRRVYHVPGSLWYEEASPERCYATEEDALADGSRPARPHRERMPGDDYAAARTMRYDTAP
jgi:hypothetical protein